MNEPMTRPGLPVEPRESNERAQTPAKLLISAAVFGAAFSYLFAFQRPGLNMFLFVLLLYGFALVNRELFIRRSFAEERLIAFLTVPAVFLAAYMFIGDTFLNALSVLVILFVMFVQYLVLSGNAKHEWYRPLFIVDIFFGAINRLFFGMGHFLNGSVNAVFLGKSEKKKGVMIGILAGTLLLMLIVPLLLMADPIFSGIAGDLFADIRIGDIFLYLFLFITGASMAAAPVATAKRSEYTGKREAVLSPEKRPVEGVTSGTILSMISAVYVLFAAVQFTYFFEPMETVAKTLGLTSSRYAVRGFGELLFITCLNLAIIAAALRFTKQQNGRTKGYIKALCCVLVAFNFVIMASSHLRLSHYESSYGYSVARFISHSFMVFLIIVNALMLLKIFIGKMSAVKYIALAALLYFCALVAINPESAVARGNIRRYYASGKIDTEYMLSLSSGAVCEACDFLKENPGLLDEDTRKAAMRRLTDYARRNGGWQSLNLADETAYKKLRELL